MRVLTDCVIARTHAFLEMQALGVWSLIGGSVVSSAEVLQCLQSTYDHCGRWR